MKKEINTSPKKMKVLAVGDLHFKDSYLPRCEIMVKEITSHIERLRPDVVVCLGDTLNDFGRISLRCLSRVEKWFVSISAFAPVFILIGNHDRTNNRDFLTDDHPFVSLASVPQITVVSKPVRTVVDGLTLVMVPYVWPGRFAEALQTIDIDPATSDVAAYFAHQEMEGILQADIGDPWEPSWPPLISGHIHAWSHYKPNVYYTGTPMQVSINESPERSISLFEITRTSCEETRVWMKTVPSMEYHNLTCKQFLKFKAKPLEEAWEARIRVTATRAEISKSEFQLHRDNLVHLGYGVTVTVQEVATTAAPRTRGKGFKELMREEVASQAPEIIPRLQSLLSKIEAEFSL